MPGTIGNRLVVDRGGPDHVLSHDVGRVAVGWLKTNVAPVGGVVTFDQARRSVTPLGKQPFASRIEAGNDRQAI